jgi:hypothetical protein
MRRRIVPIAARGLSEGRRLMRTATIVSLICVATALSGCGPRNVEFVASNPDSVLLDLPAKQPGELVIANDTATQQCQIYSRRSAVLESLNVRSEDRIRATYLCKGGGETTTSTRLLRRQ